MKNKNPRNFWKLFRKKKQSVDCDDISLDDFYKHFPSFDENLGNTSNHEAENFVYEHDFNSDYTNYQELDRRITYQEIEKVVRDLKRNKSYASDNLLNEYFIESVDILSSLLEDLFNNIFNSGYFPDSWCEGTIIHLKKK